MWQTIFFTNNKKYESKKGSGCPNSYKTNKRKIIKRASIGVAIIAGLGIAAFTTVYSIAKSNINYTVEEAKAIVLQSVPGEIVRVNKRLDLDTFTFEYKFKIKDKNNMLIKADVNSSFGVITDLDSYYD